MPNNPAGYPAKKIRSGPTLVESYQEEGDIAGVHLEAPTDAGHVGVVGGHQVLGQGAGHQINLHHGCQYQVLTQRN